MESDPSWHVSYETCVEAGGWWFESITSDHDLSVQSGVDAALSRQRSRVRIPYRSLYYHFMVRCANGKAIGFKSL